MKNRQFVHSAKTNGSNPIVFSSRVRDALWPASRNCLARSEKSNTQIFLQLNNMNQTRERRKASVDAPELLFSPIHSLADQCGATENATVVSSKAFGCCLNDLNTHGSSLQLDRVLLVTGYIAGGVSDFRRLILDRRVHYFAAFVNIFFPRICLFAHDSTSNLAGEANLCKEEHDGNGHQEHVRLANVKVTEKW